VQLDGHRVKASRAVRAGDTIELTIGIARRTVTVTGLAERRGPRERGRDSVRRDARLTGSPRAAREGTGARTPVWSQPGSAPHEAGSAPTRRSAPWAAARALNAQTADQPLRVIYRKLGLATRAEAAAYAVRNLGDE
jgi:hypothetical protein